MFSLVQVLLLLLFVLGLLLFIVFQFHIIQAKTFVGLPVALILFNRHFRIIIRCIQVLRNHVLSAHLYNNHHKIHRYIPASKSSPVDHSISASPVCVCHQPPHSSYPKTWSTVLDSLPSSNRRAWTEPAPAVRHALVEANPLPSWTVLPMYQASIPNQSQE